MFAPDRVEKYFRREHSQFVLDQSVQTMVRFEERNIAHDDTAVLATASFRRRLLPQRDHVPVGSGSWRSDRAVCSRPYARRIPFSEPRRAAARNLAGISCRARRGRLFLRAAQSRRIAGATENRPPCPSRSRSSSTAPAPRRPLHVSRCRPPSPPGFVSDFQLDRIESRHREARAASNRRRLRSEPPHLVRASVSAQLSCGPNSMTRRWPRWRRSRPRTGSTPTCFC